MIVTLKNKLRIQLSKFLILMLLLAVDSASYWPYFASTNRIMFVIKLQLSYTAQLEVKKNNVALFLRF